MMSAFCASLIPLCERKIQERSGVAKWWLCSSMKSFTYHCLVSLLSAMTILASHPQRVIFRGFLFLLSFFMCFPSRNPSRLQTNFLRHISFVPLSLSR
uniref:Uncharacterized protein n=1 Tax=Arundo donax TaxID=35708 RepID=A0A0A9H6Q0_ARUDO